VKEATLLEVGRWKTGCDADKHFGALFRARELLGFCALANRQPFLNHLPYVNYDTYKLVIQRFQPGDPDTFVFTTRRRDGATQQLWSSREFVHYRPDHVEGHARVEVDRKLLHALWKISQAAPHVMEAITHFNLASTDSSDVPEYVELVMMKSAFEALLQINHKAEAFVDALNAVAGLISDKPDGPMRRKWRARWPKAGRPLAAWARDFCVARNAAAHGGGKAGNSVWPARIHLAFAAVLFPLLVRKIMSTKSLLSMDRVSAEKLALIDSYLMHNPFAFNWRKAGMQVHPWVRLHNNARSHVQSQEFHEHFLKKFKSMQASSAAVP
jgi:hypothetical protein